MSEQTQTEQHHIWCNFWMRPRKGCKQCEHLYRKCPPKLDDTEDDLMARHFPDVLAENKLAK